MVAFPGLRLCLGDRPCDGLTKQTPRSSCCIGKGGSMGHARRRVLMFVGCVGCGAVTLCVYGMSQGSIGSSYAALRRSGFGI